MFLEMFEWSWRNKKKKLMKAEREAILSGNNVQVRQLTAEIEVLLDREAIMWQQRSRLL